MNVVFSDDEKKLPIATPAIAVLRTQVYLMQLLKTPMEQAFEFITPYGQGQIILQRVRVQWSRVKTQLRLKNVPFKDFKILSDVKENKDEWRDLVRLKRSMNGRIEFDLRELNEIMELLK